jgi:hypothetical protein
MTDTGKGRLICFDCQSPQSKEPATQLHPLLVGRNPKYIFKCSGCGYGVMDWYYYQIWKEK